jgi:hypothetical protein
MQKAKGLQRKNATLKLAAVTLIKDEGDIIELFLKLNLRVFDRIFVFDHMSTDNTKEIIFKMREAGYSVAYTYYPAPQFQQSKAITYLVQQVARMDLYDYIVPLDADEFLMPAADLGPDDLGECLASTQWGKAPWRTYCPVSDDYFGPQAPLFSHFRARRVEPTRLRKVVIGNTYGKNCTVLEGNHKAYNLDLPGEAVTLPLVFAHVPVRSEAQILRKALMGSYALSLKSERFPNEGNHWDAMAACIRAAGFRVSPEQLTNFALQYMNARGITDNTIVHDGPRLGEPDDTIELTALAQRPLLAAFDGYIGQLIEQLQAARASCAPAHSSPT